MCSARLRLPLAVIAITGAIGLATASADAAVHRATMSFDPPTSPPTLGGTPSSSELERNHEYDHAISVAYDDAAGSVVVKIAEYAADYWGQTLPSHELLIGDTCSQASAMGSGTLDIQTSQDQSSPSTSQDQSSASSAPVATATLRGTPGSLSSTSVFDGQAFTFSFTDPLLTRHDWHCFSFPAASDTVSLDAWPILLQPIFGQPQDQPRRLDFFKYGRAFRVAWRTWGGSTASAVGRGSFHICTTSCSAGRDYFRSVAITASRIRVCDGVREYTYVLFRYLGKRIPGDPHRSGVGGAVCDQTLWFGNQHEPYSP